MRSRAKARRETQLTMSGTPSPIDCHIECGPFSAASSQIFTGFALLSHRGDVNASVRRSNANWRGQSTIIAVVLGDGTRLIYDLLDAARIRQDALDWSDHYFKRSYAPGIAPEAAQCQGRTARLQLSRLRVGRLASAEDDLERHQLPPTRCTQRDSVHHWT